jgi:fucose 4-O-acetylase-like acetyltransferase
MGESLNNRDLRIDILRVAGLLLIILAHVSPPFLLFQFRTFDVPLMVFVSGLSYLAAGKK